MVRLAIHEFLKSGAPSGQDVDRFLDGHEFPLAEGPNVTFVFRGEADAVRLQHWIYGLASSQPFRRVDGTDLWWLVIELPPGSRVEYKLEIVRGGVHELIRDPRNPNLAHDPFGANSVLHGSGYTTPSWAEPDAQVPPVISNRSSSRAARSVRCGTCICTYHRGVAPRVAIRSSSCTTARTTSGTRVCAAF